MRGRYEASGPGAGGVPGRGVGGPQAWGSRRGKRKWCAGTPGSRGAGQARSMCWPPAVPPGAARLTGAGCFGNQQAWLGTWRGTAWSWGPGALAVTSIWAPLGPDTFPWADAPCSCPGLLWGSRGMAQPANQTSKGLSVLSYCPSSSPWALRCPDL